MGGRTGRARGAAYPFTVLISFLFSTGCRVSEASDCKIGFLDIARGRVNFYRRKVNDWLDNPLGLAQERVLAYLKENSEIDPAAYKELTGQTRKFTVPLMEFFDAEKLTRRRGNVRVLR